MKTRYRLVCRGLLGGVCYCLDKKTKKRVSLNTTNVDEAQQIIEAKNNAERQPLLNTPKLGQFSRYLISEWVDF